MSEHSRLACWRTGSPLQLAFYQRTVFLRGTPIIAAAVANIVTALRMFENFDWMSEVREGLCATVGSDLSNGWNSMIPSSRLIEHRIALKTDRVKFFSIA